MKNATAAAIFLAITDFVTLLYEGTFVVQETGNPSSPLVC